jgi:SagB-type dehydrogenase family enzyme
MAIKLPLPRTRGNVSVEETIERRRSKRRFTAQSLSWEQISQLLWAAQGITGKAHGFRTVPSAGALYPLELYLVSKEGVYHYDPERHELEQTIGEDRRSQLCRASLGQKFVERAPVSIVIAAVFSRVERIYGRRAARYTILEAGHAAQNIHLQAVALGLGSVPVGAFQDEQVGKALQLPENHEPLYIISVGYTAE